MNRRHRALVRAIPPLVLMGLIFYLSSQPAAGDLAWWEVVLRKFGHVGGYAALTVLWAWALGGLVGRPLLIAACIALAYAGTDEFHQSLVETRHGTPIDVGVDAIGIALAATAMHARRLPRGGQGEPAREQKLARSSPAR